MQEKTGAKILIRGKGALKDGMPSTHPDDEDELHVAIEGSEEAVERAQIEVQQILYNPEEAMKLKATQLQNLAEMNGSTTVSLTASIYGPGSDSSESLEMNVPNNLV